MRRNTGLLVCLLAFAVFLCDATASEAKYQCIECHSRSSGARAMHEALQGQDCFTCHVRGEKLRQKGGIPKEKHEVFLKQRLTDPRCTLCHGERAVERSHEHPGKHPTMLSGNSYCPKCQIKGARDWKTCPRCGAPLLDLDRIMRQSGLNPDDTLCRTCHFIEGDLEKGHIEHVGQEFAAESDCLGGCRKTPICGVILVPRHCSVL